MVGIQRNSVSIRLSRDECSQLMLKYNVLCEKKTNTRNNLRENEKPRCVERSIQTRSAAKRTYESEAPPIIAETDSYNNRCDSVSISKACGLPRPNKQQQPQPEYNLRGNKRPRCLENLTTAPPAKKPCKVIARSNVPKPKLITARKDILIEGLIVLAKMNTYPAWPALIKTFRKTVVTVQFFGENSTGNVKYDQIGLFAENHALIRANLKKTINGYSKAVSCAEGALQIPHALSILN